MKISLPRLRRRAFTLLELLISVVVIGILASLALIKFGSVQEKAYVATMQSDLRNFATARSIHISDADAVPSSVSQVTGYSFSESVFELSYQSLSASEWSLAVGHAKTSTACTLSALDLSKTHRISCGEAESTDFTALGTGPNTVEFDASGAIAALAFSGDAAFHAALAAAPADIESVSWDFGDGAKASGTPDTHTKVSHTYASPGDYTVTLVLVKKTGEVAKGTKTVPVSGNTAPVASFTFSPSAPSTSDAVQFTSTSTDAEGDALSFAWDFQSDGVTDATTASPHFTFSSAATYAVKLTVTDAKGASASQTQSVTVVAVAAPSAIGGLRVWWDASTLSASNGAPVSSWTDRQSGVVAGLVGSATAPVYQSQGMNGRPALWFDGQSNRLQTAAIDLAGTSEDMSVFIVTHPSTSQPGSFQEMIDWHHYDGTVGNFVTRYSDFGTYWAGSSGGGVSWYGPTSTISRGVPTILGSIKAGTSASNYQNGTTLGIGSVPADFITRTSPLAIANWVPDTSRGYQGAVAEVLIYNKALSTAELDEMHRYLADKYGLTVSLSTGSYTPAP